MQQNFAFSPISSTHELKGLHKKWLESLTSPQDGMWESFRDNANKFKIYNRKEVIGYACIGEEQLLQFFLIPEYMRNGMGIFNQFIKEFNIKNGIVGSNNPIYLSFALYFASNIDIHTYLFRGNYEINVNSKTGTFKMCKTKELERIVEFCRYSIGASQEWLREYISTLINHEEIYFLEKKGVIIGTCEVRKSKTAPEYADIGMVVSPDYRRQGVGTYLLHRAKNIAIDSNKVPICSCEKNNVGSLKAIQNCGFYSKFQLLSITFE